MAVAAELPDIDTLWSLRGPVASFQHHRGITHTFLGIPFEAAFVVAAIYGLHRWRESRTSSTTNIKPLTVAPVRWGLLYCFALLALLSHLLLDYTNNYGIRPFFPFDPHWYAASIVFIFDPLIFALLLAALILPALFRLISSEVGARRQPFAARGWAVAALLGVASLWTLRETQHIQAVQLAMSQSIQAPNAAGATSPDSRTRDESPQPSDDSQPAPPEPPPVYLQPTRALASPDPISPFRWFTVSDFGPLYQLAEVNTRNNAFVPSQATFPKLNPSPALLAAEASPLGRAYLDWSPMPFITVIPPADPLASNHTAVNFADPRFMGDTLLLHVSGRTPLSGSVELDSSNHVIRQTLDGKPQRP